MTETTLSDDSENQGSGDVYRLLDSQCGEGGHEAFWEYTMEHSQTPEEYMAGAAVFGEELRSLTAGNDSDWPEILVREAYMRRQIARLPQKASRRNARWWSPERTIRQAF